VPQGRLVRDHGRVTTRRPVAAVIGGVSWNQIVDVPHLPVGRTETIWATGSRVGIGATGAGKALNLARLGFDTRLHALVGRDGEGDLASAELEAAGVTLTRVDDPAGTERHLNLMDPEGRRASVYVNDSTYDPPVSEDDLAQFVDGADYVWVNLANYARRALPALAARGIPAWVDIHDWDGLKEHHREFVDAARYLVMSDEGHLDALGLAAMLAPTREVVVVTHGRRGATAFVGDEDPISVPPVPVTPVDANGAGDAFGAGVMFGRSRGWDWPRSLAAGSVVAAGCVQSEYLADPGLSPEWVERRLAEEGV
jgi:sugar/nucleoside kinase (ribokinase family)